MSFRITIRNRQLSFITRRGETILEAAKRQAINLPHGCGAGVCGVCMSQIVSGEIDYPDGAPMALFEEDLSDNKALYCQAVPASDVVMDVPADEDWEAWD